MKCKLILVAALIAVLLLGVAALFILPELELFDFGVTDNEDDEDKKKPSKVTVAAVIGEHEIDSVALSYYYSDAISESYQEWYNQYGSNTAVYLQILMGLDLSAPLDEQVYDTKTGQTWADRFVELAIENAKHTYVLCDLAAAAGFALDEDAKKSIDSQIDILSLYASIYGYSSADKYLSATYCKGANEESYRKYLEMSAIADAYLVYHANSLSYTEAQIRQYAKGKESNYNSYTYSTVYLNYTYFLDENQKIESGDSFVYPAEAYADAQIKAREVAESLLEAKDYKSLSRLVENLEINRGSTVVSANVSENVLGSNLPSLLKDWLTDSGRRRGNNTVIENSYTVEGGETSINGYYVVIFDSVNNNQVPTVDVRHLLVGFVDDGNDNKKDDNGNVIYTAVEKAAAKEKAEKLLKDWEAMEGGKTLENFKILVQENTDDSGSKESGGLYENIAYAQNYVEPFLNWCLDANRVPGEVEIIKTEYGFHIMYFVETNEMNYRNLLITEDMRTEDTQKWYDNQMKAVTAQRKDTSKLNLDYIISG